MVPRMPEMERIRVMVEVSWERFFLVQRRQNYPLPLADRATMTTHVHPDLFITDQPALRPGSTFPIFVQRRTPRLPIHKGITT